MAPNGELLYVGFNQDYGCFACGTDSGFRIYNCDPFKETFDRKFTSGGIGIVEMLFRCNILALVGGGDNPRYPVNKVMIWDDHQNRCIGELSFRSEVKAVKLRRDRVVVVLLNKIYVYNFADLKLVDHIETIANPKGLCALCPNPDNRVLACPGVSRGTVRVELYDNRKTTLVPAHEAELSQICLNQNGTRLATASEKGTLIRVFDTQKGELLQELRRGAAKADLQSICFNISSTFLACSSDQGTIHLFALGGEQQERISANPNDGGEMDVDNSKSSFAFMKSVLPKYFSSQWSFAQLRPVPKKSQDGGVGGPVPGRDNSRSIVAFGSEKNTIIVVSDDGTFYKATFDTIAGTCEQTEDTKFLSRPNETD